MPTKQDYPALLPPGIHNMTFAQFEALTVAPFPSDMERMRIFTLFGMWLDGVRSLKVSGTLWLDGSFLTKKEGPGDIDCVFWLSNMIPVPSNKADKIKAAGLFSHNAAKAQYSIDLYTEKPLPDQEILHREAYWRGFFGFQHDRRTAKGFAEIKL